MRDDLFAVRYAVRVTVSQLSHRGRVLRNVVLSLFRPDTSATEYSQAAYEEMYNDAEVAALIPEVLAKMPRLVEVTVAPYTLADLARAMPYGALPVGGNSGCWQIDCDPDWTLPFGTWAYYDVTGCEIIADDEVPML